MSITVSFEDEGGELGPVVVIDRELYDRDPVVAQSGVGIPYGYKPQGLTELGWLTRSEALAVAASHGVTLESGDHAATARNARRPVMSGEERVQRIRELLLTRIERYGYTMTQVIGSESHPGYTYTLGLPRHIGHPELAVWAASTRNEHRRDHLRRRAPGGKTGTRRPGRRSAPRGHAPVDRAVACRGGDGASRRGRLVEAAPRWHAGEREADRGL